MFHLLTHVPDLRESSIRHVLASVPEALRSARWPILVGHAKPNEPEFGPGALPGRAYKCHAPPALSVGRVRGVRGVAFTGHGKPNEA